MAPAAETADHLFQEVFSNASRRGNHLGHAVNLPFQIPELNFVFRKLRRLSSVANKSLSLLVQPDDYTPCA